MECKQALETITASLDGEVDQILEFLLQNHLKSCPRCRSEYELEQVTKLAVSRRIKRVAVPEELSAWVASGLARERDKELQSKFSFADLLAFPSMRMMTAMGGAMAMLIIIFLLLPSRARHTHIVPNDGNIIHQTYSSLDGMMSGELAPQISSQDPSVVQAYMAHEAGFNVNVPPLSKCRLLGGKCSKYSGENVAHIIYEHDGDVICLYEARLNSVMQGNALNLPPEAKLQLAKTGRYIENHVPNCTIVIWESDSSTICCAAAEMDAPHLISYLEQK